MSAWHKWRLLLSQGGGAGAGPPQATEPGCGPERNLNFEEGI
jgi:hypothetical protein